MALRDYLPWTKRRAIEASKSGDVEMWDYNVSAAKTLEAIGIYENNAITCRGEPLGYDFGAILRNPQKRIYDLYRLATYYNEIDPYVGAAVSNIYVPFTIGKGYKLVGASEKTKRLYMEHYNDIGLNDRLSSIAFQYFLYRNVFIYLMPDGSMLSLVPTRCRISEIYMNGDPVVEYDTDGILNPNYTDMCAKEDFIDDLKARLRGLPPEIQQNFLRGKERTRWVQLNPENTFALQAPKPDWVRYAVPTIAKCLSALARKALISDYEKAQLNLKIKSFLQVRVGDKDQSAGVVKPDRRHIEQMYNAYETAVKRSSLVVVPWYVNSEYITVDTDELFDQDKYGGVNAEILSAFGISGVASLGQQSAGSFGQAKLSLDTAALRIRYAQNSIVDLMNRINRKLADRIPYIATKNIPKFEFEQIDLTNDEHFADAVYKLWMQGVTSTKTLLESYHLDMEQEKERRQAEVQNGTDDLFTPRQKDKDQSGNATGKSDDGADESVRGRPTLDDTDRNSDPENSITGRAPKPSNPKGSDAQ